ncbi:MAG: heavy-metal-associated domain-containing protein [Sphingopyxis sp.]
MTDKKPSGALHKRASLALFGALLLASGGVVLAQIEAGDRGIAPINSSNDLMVSGITVDVTADSPEEARQKGWQEAQRKGWAALFRQVNGASGAPALPDSTLNGIVSAIVIEREQIGLGRYRATLGITFDRARAGQILGISGRVFRSPPLLVVPVIYEGGVAQVFERRSEWQRAWAHFRTSDSSIDYVRTSGSGGDLLLLNVGQQRRRNRAWWRDILDQYGASDVLFPSVRVERMWPGGPIIGYFSARYGPDNELIGNFTLTARSPDGLRQMMVDGVRRIDALYITALADGRLRTDPSLIIEAPIAPEEIEKVEEVTTAEGAGSEGSATVTPIAPVATSSDFSVQIETPDALGVIAAETGLRAVSGVESASASSVAIGGVSVLRVRYRGDAAGLRAALSAAGWRVSQNGNTFRISR